MKKIQETEELVSSMSALYGNIVTSADIRAYCSMNDLNYQTVTKKLESYKESRARWNLDLEVTREVVDDIEKSYHLPAHNHENSVVHKKIDIIQPEEVSLIPDKDPTFVSIWKFF